MSSGLQSTLAYLQINNYFSVAMVTAVVYDYLLTCSQEIDYIWCGPWTWISAIFTFVRYFGLSWIILTALDGSIFIPGPEKVTVSMRVRLSMVPTRELYPKGTIIALVTIWGYPVFIAAIDLVMILRVYALWKRSRVILYSLLLVYAIQIVMPFIAMGIYESYPTHLKVKVIRVLDFSFCDYTFHDSPHWIKSYIILPRTALGVVLFVLAIIPTLMQSISMYKATKQWQPNRYMQLLVRDGIVYFVVYMLLNVIAWMENAGAIKNIPLLFLNSLCYVAICSMMPRFIINVRALYARDLRGRFQAIQDTGFGIVLQSAESDTIVMSPIEFVLDDAPNRSQTLATLGGVDEPGRISPQEQGGSVNPRLDQSMTREADESREVNESQEIQLEWRKHGSS